MSQRLKRIIKNQEDYHNNIIDYIPTPAHFGLFREWYPGTRRGEYVGVTGNTSSGKTQLTKELYLFNTIEFFIRNKKKGKILWFGMEESFEEFEYSLLSYLLFRVSADADQPTRLNIMDFLAVGRSISKKDLAVIEQYDYLVDVYLSYIEFFPFKNRVNDIYTTCMEYAMDHGVFTDKYDQESTKEDVLNKNVAKFFWKDPDTFHVVVFDHVGLVDGSSSLYDNVGELSKQAMFLSTKLGMISVAVVQQMAAQEDIEHINAKRVMPSIQGTGDNKSIVRDFKTYIGIGNLHRYDISDTTLDSRTTKKIKLNLKKLEIGQYYRELIILKNRYGLVGMKTGLGFDGKVGFMQNIEDELAATDFVNKMRLQGLI